MMVKMHFSFFKILVIDIKMIECFDGLSIITLLTEHNKNNL